MNIPFDKDEAELIRQHHELYTGKKLPPIEDPGDPPYVPPPPRPFRWKIDSEGNYSGDDMVVMAIVVNSGYFTPAEVTAIRTLPSRYGFSEPEVTNGWNRLYTLAIAISTNGPQTDLVVEIKLDVSLKHRPDGTRWWKEVAGSSQSKDIDTPWAKASPKELLAILIASLVIIVFATALIR